MRKKSIRDLRFYSHGLGQFAEEMLESDSVNAESGRFVSMLQSVFMAELLKCYLIMCSHDNNSSQLFKSLRLAIVQTLFVCAGKEQDAWNSTGLFWKTTMAATRACGEVCTEQVQWKGRCQWWIG